MRGLVANCGREDKVAGLGAAASHKEHAGASGLSGLSGVVGTQQPVSSLPRLARHIWCLNLPEKLDFDVRFLSNSSHK